MISKNHKESLTIWQTQPDGLPEQAILIEVYSDSVYLQQQSDRVSINYESIDEIVKTLRKIQRERK